MTIRFALPKSGITIEAEQQTDLVTQYAGLSGDRDFLVAHIKRAVTAFEHGPAVATAQEKLGGEVIEDTHDPDADSQVVDDPWAEHPSQRTTQSVPSRSRPVSTKSDQPTGFQHKFDPAQYLGEDNFAQKFYRDANAPQCDCGVQAIRMAGRSGPNSKKPGSPYSAYVCYDAGPREAGCDYRQKCDFREFINTKK